MDAVIQKMSLIQGESFSFLYIGEYYIHTCCAVRVPFLLYESVISQYMNLNFLTVHVSSNLVHLKIDQYNG